MEKIFEYGELKARFDVTDFIQMERAEAAIAEFGKKAAEIDKVPPGIERIKASFFAAAAVLEKSFNDEEAANKALGGTASLDDVMGAVFAFVDFVRKQDMAIAKRWETLASKYSPKRKK